MTKNPNPIGANCTIYFRDTPDTIEHRYISFSNYDEDTDCDGFGVSDDEVFFYTSDYKGFTDMMANEASEDFVVTSYELEYGAT